MLLHWPAPLVSTRIHRQQTSRNALNWNYLRQNRCKAKRTQQKKKKTNHNNRNYTKNHNHKLELNDWNYVILFFFFLVNEDEVHLVLRYIPYPASLYHSQNSNIKKNVYYMWINYNISVWIVYSRYYFNQFSCTFIAFHFRVCAVVMSRRSRAIKFITLRNVIFSVVRNRNVNDDDQRCCLIVDVQQH